MKFKPNIYNHDLDLLYKSKLLSFFDFSPLFWLQYRMIKNNKANDLIKAINTLTNKRLYSLFEPIFKRCKNFSLPFFQQRINDIDKSFNLNKIDQLSKILISKLIKTKDIYVNSNEVIKEFCQINPLTKLEAEALFDYMIIDMSLWMLAQSNMTKLSDEETFFIKKWNRLDPYFLIVIARDASGFSAIAQYDRIINWLNSADCQPRQLFEFDLNKEKQTLLRFDSSQAHISMIHDVKSHQAYVENLLTESQARYAIGLYGEERACYQAPQFKSDVCHESRSVHLGIDVFLNAYEKLYAPLDGEVISLKYNGEELDYGYTIILEHVVGETETKFYTLYGHLSKRSLELTKKGDIIKAGQAIGYIGDNTENGGWSPHLHFQIMTHMLSCTSDFYGACEASLWPLWKQICPDPNLLMKVSINK